MKVNKKIRSRREILLNYGRKSTARLIKNKCKARPAKQRSMIKTRRLNVLIKTGAIDKRLKDSNILDGSFINKKKRNPFIPEELYFLSKRDKDWIKYISHKKINSSIPAEPSVLIDRNALGNQITNSRVNHPFIPVESIISSQESNTLKKESSCRLEESTSIGAYLFQKKESWSSAPRSYHPGETSSMVKYKKVSEKSEIKELIKNSNRLPCCFTIRV